MATQAERRSSTRSRLLEAATTALVEQGYERLTTTVVVERSGLSRGALFDHFPTKNDLLAAVAEHLFAALRAEYEQAFEALAALDTVTIGDALALLAQSVSDRRYHAALDLYAAARTDDELRESLTPVVERHGEHVWELADALPIDMADAERDRFRALVRLAFMAMQGAVLQEQARPDEPAVDQVLVALRHLGGVADAEDAA